MVGGRFATMGNVMKTLAWYLLALLCGLLSIGALSVALETGLPTDVAIAVLLAVAGVWAAYRGVRRRRTSKSTPDVRG